MNGAGDASMMDAYFASGSIEALATVLVNDAYAGSCSSNEATIESNAPVKAHSIPDSDEENVEPGHSTDPLEPRRGHRPKPTDPLPVEAPPVPKLRPLEAD